MGWQPGTITLSLRAWGSLDTAAELVGISLFPTMAAPWEYRAIGSIDAVQLYQTIPLTAYEFDALPAPNAPGEKFVLSGISLQATGNTQTIQVLPPNVGLDPNYNGPWDLATQYEWQLDITVDYPTAYDFGSPTRSGATTPGRLFNLRVLARQKPSVGINYGHIWFFGGCNDLSTPPPYLDINRQVAYVPAADAVTITTEGLKVTAAYNGVPVAGSADFFAWGFRVTGTRSGSLQPFDGLYGDYTFYANTNAVEFMADARAEMYIVSVLVFDAEGYIYAPHSSVFSVNGFGCDAVADQGGDVLACGPPAMGSTVVLTNSNPLSTAFARGFRRFTAAESGNLEYLIDSDVLGYGTVAADTACLQIVGGICYALTGTRFKSAQGEEIVRYSLYASRDSGKTFSTVKSLLWNRCDLATLCAIPAGGGLGSAAIRLSDMKLVFKHAAVPEVTTMAADDEDDPDITLGGWPDEVVEVADLTGLAMLGASPVNAFWLLASDDDSDSTLYLTDGLTRAFVSYSLGSSWSEIDFVAPAFADVVRVRCMQDGAFLWIGLLIANSGATLSYQAFRSYDNFQSWLPCGEPVINTDDAFAPVIGQMTLANSSRLFASNGVNLIQISDDFATWTDN